MREKRYMISDASKTIDVEPHVLRYWEIELAIDIPRNELGHRYYTGEHVELLKSVKALKDKGFQLKAIKLLLPDIKKVEALEVDRLFDLRDKLEIAMGLVGIDASEKEHLRTKEIYETALSMEKEDVEVKGEIKGLEPGVKENGNPSNVFGQTEPLEACNDSKDQKAVRTDVVPVKEEESRKAEHENKLGQFRNIMCGIMVEAMNENNEQLTKSISDSVTDSVIKEFEYLLRMKEEREEEHFKQLDRTIREYQIQRQQTAATKEPGGYKKKESKFFKKNKKVRI